MVRRRSSVQSRLGALEVRRYRARVGPQGPQIWRGCLRRREMYTPEQTFLTSFSRKIRLRCAPEGWQVMLRAGILISNARGRGEAVSRDLAKVTSPVRFWSVPQDILDRYRGNVSCARPRNTASLRRQQPDPASDRSRRRDVDQRAMNRRQHALVAERQTRWTQTPVSART
jgi:hypothetical protein